MPIEYNKCLGLVRSIMGIGKNVVWGEEEDIGYDSLIRSSIHYKAKMLKENAYLEQGLLLSGEAKYVLVELYSGQIQKRYQDIKQYDRYAFASSNCQSPPDGELICTNCATIRKPLRRLCRSRYEQNSKSINKNTKTTLLELASPSKLTEKIDMVVDDLRSVRKSNRYLKSCLEEKRVKHGIVMKTEQSCVLFDEDAEVEAMKVIGSNGDLKAGKRLLARLLWNQLVIATRDAKSKGSKQVRYHPVMIRFAMMIRSKMNRGSYDFLASVFNLPSSRTVSKYDSVDGSSKDGVLYEVVRLLKGRLGDKIRNGKQNGMTDDQIEWMRMGSLSFDSMSIKNKVKFDPNTHELVGFAEGALKEDVLLQELDALDVSDEKKVTRPDLSQ